MRMLSQNKLGAVHWLYLSRLRGVEAAALIEFAVALPLLVVLVIGIFDFGGAFNLKQELNNAVREGAIYGASQPTNDLNNASTPPSVDAVRYLVASYLQAARINDCDLSKPTTTGALVTTMTWLYTTKGSCPGTADLTLTIERGCLAANCPFAGTYPNGYVASTYVRIVYPYQFHFNNVIKLLVPSADYSFLVSIPSDATAANFN